MAVVFLNLFALTALGNKRGVQGFLIRREKINRKAQSNFLLVESCAQFVSTKPGFLSITWPNLQNRPFHATITTISRSLLCQPLNVLGNVPLPISTQLEGINHPLSCFPPLPLSSTQSPAAFSCDPAFPADAVTWQPERTFFFSDQYSINPYKFISSDS